MAVGAECSKFGFQWPIGALSLFWLSACGSEANCAKKRVFICCAIMLVDATWIYGKPDTQACQSSDGFDFRCQDPKYQYEISLGSDITPLCGHHNTTITGHPRLPVPSFPPVSPAACPVARRLSRPPPVPTRVTRETTVNSVT
ncbi:hypothetical protein GGX14DRAFT_595618 [Mycena pura]|uniref:Uncharacterized protein n=1 Tax=Mycena pura TaxID=153505 RepID=A0AAD6UU46_9AGAR|nr:hypothetical protein GGX14DRAFT_595618 [Mycena pura]